MKTAFTLILFTFLFGYLSAQQTFTNLQKASIVIGQPNFTTDYSNISDSILFGPASCAISSKGVLAVAEQWGWAVRIWNKLPTTNGEPSDIVINLPAMVNGIAWSPDGNKLIATGGDSLIYIWNTVPTINKQAPDVKVLIYNKTPVSALVTPSGKLLVSEEHSNRILVWNTIPTINDTPADYVIGQPDFNSVDSGNASNKFYHPWGIDISPNGELLVADLMNNRILIFDSVPSDFGDSATHLIGQTNFGLSTPGCSDSTLSRPVGVTVTVDGQVAVSEIGNSRITIWSSVPVSNNEKAKVVLGQLKFNTETTYYPSGVPTDKNLQGPCNISSDINGRLFVCGKTMHRILVFGSLPEKVTDLSISFEESAENLCDSSAILYRIKIKNLGADTARDVVATAAFPDGFTLFQSNPNVGTYNKLLGYWNLPSILPGDSAILKLYGMVENGMADKDVLTYANIIYSSTLDTVLENNGTSISKKISLKTKPSEPICDDLGVYFGKSTTLNATGAGIINWYSKIDDYSPIETGATYITGPITSPLKLYIESIVDCPSAYRVLVNVYPLYDTSIFVSICEGDSVILGSQTLFTTGNYTEVLSSTMGLDSTVNITLTVNSTPLDPIVQSVETCLGSATTCSAMGNGTINWYMNIEDSSPFIQGDTYTTDTLSKSSTFYVETIDYFGCISDRVPIEITVYPTFHINDTIKATICNGDYYTFGKQVLNSAGTYTETFSSINGCDSVRILKLDVKIINVIVHQEGKTLIAEDTLGTWQWIKCADNSEISEETSRVFITEVPGSYAVVIHQDECVFQSECHTIELSALNEAEIGNILIYPNPAINMLSINFGHNVNKYSVKILNICGQEKYYETGKNKDEISIEIDDIDSGVYFVTISTENTNQTVKIIKK